MREAESGSALRVASVEIVDDHLLFATALADLVRVLPDFSVAGVAGTGAQAIAQAAEHQPDLILLDYHLPGQLATEILPDLRKVSPSSRIIILTSDTSAATRNVASAAGVDGFLTKEQALDDVADALRGALGERPLKAAPEAPAVLAPADAARPAPAPEPEPAAAPIEAVTPPPVAAPRPGVLPAPATATVPGPTTAVSAAPPAAAPVVAPAPPEAPREPVGAILRRGAIVAVYGAKGGVGTTTVATNLAVALATSGSPTVLVDLDLGFGDVGVFLDLEGGEGIAGLALRSARIDGAMLRRILLVHPSGLRVLPTPSVPVRTRPDTSEIMGALDALRDGHFDHVVCDVPRTLSALTVGVLRSADVVVLVTTPELPALHDLGRVLARPTLALRDRAMLVVNRSPGRAGVDLDDVTRGVGLPVSATIPSEGVAVTDSINRGIALADGRSQLARAFRELAVRVSAALPERA